MCIREFCQLFYGKQHGQYGSVVCMAATGAAASNIDGYTWQNVLGMARYNTKDSMQISSNTAQLIGQRINGVKLIILDEISLINFKNLAIMEARFKAGLRANCKSDRILEKQIEDSRWGGVHFLCVGDLYQLGNYIFK